MFRKKNITLLTDVGLIHTEDGKTQRKKIEVKGSLVPHILYSVGGRASQLALCVPADNYLEPPEQDPLFGEP